MYIVLVYTQKYLKPMPQLLYINKWLNTSLSRIIALYYLVIYSEHANVVIYILIKIIQFYFILKYGAIFNKTDTLLHISDPSGQSVPVKPSALLSTGQEVPKGACLPLNDKAVEFSESDIAARRGLPSLKARIPVEAPLDTPKRLLGLVEYNIELYTGQITQFKSIVVNIDNGTEQFYPKETRWQWVQYSNMLPGLLKNQATTANDIISEIKAKDPSFSKPLYPTDDK